MLTVLPIISLPSATSIPQDDLLEEGVHSYRTLNSFVMKAQIRPFRHCNHGRNRSNLILLNKTIYVHSKLLFLRSILHAVGIPRNRKGSENGKVYPISGYLSIWTVAKCDSHHRPCGLSFLKLSEEGVSLFFSAGGSLVITLSHTLPPPPFSSYSSSPTATSRSPLSSLHFAWICPLFPFLIAVDPFAKGLPENT